MGRFDIMMDVYVSSMDDLHAVIIDKIGRIDGIYNTETFIELQRTDREPPYLAGR